MAFFFADDLVVFVAFAGQEDDVTFLRVGEDSLDGATAIGFDDGDFSDAQRAAVPGCFAARSARQLYIGREAGNYFVENAVRVLGARIVAGQINRVGEALGDPGHSRTFGA